jgi:hypothetical protein
LCHLSKITCIACNTIAMNCDNKSTTYENVLPRPGYWIDKDYFGKCRKRTDNSYDSATYSTYTDSGCAEDEMIARHSVLTYAVQRQAALQRPTLRV